LFSLLRLLLRGRLQGAETRLAITSSHCFKLIDLVAVCNCDFEVVVRSVESAPSWTYHLVLLAAPMDLVVLGTQEISVQRGSSSSSLVLWTNFEVLTTAVEYRSGALRAEIGSFGP
jgi:hypothetical protein